MDYIIMTKGGNGTFKVATFSDGTIPFYNDKAEAIADMSEGDALFSVQEIK